MYCATPWGKHVNEGIPEWPPSSWRLLRAIIATWKNTCSEIADDTVWPILQKLIKEHPEYHLPDASVSHTRHYVPTNAKKTLIMNTFLVVGNKSIYIIWKNVNLNEDETKNIAKILANMHYFGRAESWCVASTSTNPKDTNCKEFGDENLTHDAELVRVLVPNENVKFLDLSKKQPTNKNDLNYISITTNQLQDSKHIDPPGAKWIYYTRPQNCFEQNVSNHTKTVLLPKTTLIRYSIVGTVRPSISDTLRVGDLARTACMSRYGKIKNGETSAVFSGKDGKGDPLVGHIHAFYLPTYETQNMEIDHLTIVARDGFDKEELEALFSLKKLYRHDFTDISLIFEGCGMVDNFSNISILKKSKVWVSATPLVLTRHIKYRGSGSDRHIHNGPKEQIKEEIKKRYNPSYKLKDIYVDQNDKNIEKTNLKPSGFFRWRQHGRVGSDKAYNVTLEFAEPVSGPITLGYGSHFGLGMFKPQE